MGANGRVDNVNIFPSGLGLTAPGLSLFPHLFPGCHCFRVREDGSSPTSGTRFSLVRGFLL